jgi:hypothetical protein
VVNGFITRLREESIVHYGHDREVGETVDPLRRDSVYDGITSQHLRNTLAHSTH